MALNIDAAVVQEVRQPGPGGVLTQFWNDAHRGHFEQEYREGLAGVEGGLGAAVSGLLRDSVTISRTSTRDAEDLVEAALQELAEQREAEAAGVPYRPSAAAGRHHGRHRRTPIIKPKSRAELERLDEEVEGIKHKNTMGVGFRQQVIQLMERYHIKMPTVTVQYHNLNVETDALVGNAAIATVGSAFMNHVKRLVGMRAHTKRHRILKDVRGVLQPGVLTLLLGPPGSGKSTFLQVLAGRYRDRHETLQVSGNITYNGHTFEEFEPTRTAGFVSQLDLHIPQLTVHETLTFAYICQQGYKAEDFNLWAELRKAIMQRRSMASRLNLAGLGTSAAAAAGPVAEGVEDGGVGHDVAGYAGVGSAPSPLHVSEGDGAKAHRKGSGSGSSSSHGITASSGAGGDVPTMGTSGSYSQQDSYEEEACNSVEDELLAMGDKVYLSGVKVLSMMRALGIYHTKDTPVGDAMLRGVSGGERKRVTLAELLVGPRRVIFLDEISTGLDSATLYSIVKQMSEFTHGFQTTALVSLLQPPPEVFNVFDDLCLMSEGCVVYHGPVGGAIGFFSSLGFVCPPRKDVPSFLQEVTTAAGQLQYASPELLAAKGVDPLQCADAGRSFLVPPEEMAATFWATTQAGKDMQVLLDTPYDKAQSHAAALVTSKYALNIPQMLQVVSQRQLLLVLKDPVLIKGRLIQIVVIGLLLGGLFFQAQHTVAGSRTIFGALFLAIMFQAMGAMPQLPMTMSTKPVWYKMRDAQFYPGWVHAAATSISQIPVSLIDSVAWSLVTYWMWGLYPGAGYFFTYFLIMLCTNICCGCLFRMIACIAPDGVAANSIGGLVLLILVVMSGFSIVRGSIPPWWIWAYYISPFAWSMRAVVINEFTSPNWDAPSTRYPGQTIGYEALNTFDFFTERKWIWGGVGFLIGSAILFTAISGWVLQHLSPRYVAQVPDEDAVEATRKEAARRKMEAAGGSRTGSGVPACGAAQVVPEPVVKAGNSPAVTAAAAAAQAVTSVGGDQGAAAAAAQAVVSAAPAAGAAASVQQQLQQSSTGQQQQVAVTVKSAIPFTPVTLVFQDLRYFVPNPSYNNGKVDVRKELAAGAAASSGKQAADGKAAASAGPPPTLELLKGITGYAVPGQLTALMGGSGAGKTTLMDCIAGRKTVGVITGDITVNGHPKDQATWARVVGYCEQMDIHTPSQTVREALLFSARLRLPQSVTRHQMLSYVDEVMDMVDLVGIQLNLVGHGSGSGLSVEQRKRLTIGVELVASPSVVFMDEPTSGLDARAAAIVMRAVRAVAQAGRAVLVTIHQPSIEIFESFDNLLLLQRGGRTTYFGPLGLHSSSLVAYLESVPGCPPIQPGYNPATWMLEVTGGAVAVAARAVDADWPEVYRTSQLAASNAAYAVQLVDTCKARNTPLQVEGGKYATDFNTQMWALWDKYWSSYWRTPSYNLTRFVVTVLVAILYGSIYYKVADFSYPAQLKNVQNVMGVIFSSTSFMGMTNMMAAMPIIGLERVVYYREQSVAAYNPWAFALATNFVEYPYIIAQVVLFVCIMYFMIGYVATAGHFFFYLLFALESIVLYVALGTTLVHLTPSQQLAQVAASGLNFLFNIFNGFVITYPNMARGWRWINRIVPTTWVLYGLAGDQLGNNDGAMDYPPDRSIKTVSQFLNTVFGYEYATHWWCLLIVFAYIAALRMGGVLAMRYISFLRR